MDTYWPTQCLFGNVKAVGSIAELWNLQEKDLVAVPGVYLGF